MRHGKAEGNYDGEEPALTARGESEVNKIGAVLSSKKIQLDQIYHSGKLRARQTAEIVDSHLSGDIPINKKEGLKPNDPVSVIADKLSDESRNILVVGHLPFMAKLTSHLMAKTESDSTLSFRTASVACLEDTDSTGWSLVWFIFPEDDIRDE